MLALPDVREEMLLSTGAVLVAADIPAGRSEFFMAGRASSANAMCAVQFTAPVVTRAKVKTNIKSAFESGVAPGPDIGSAFTLDISAASLVLVV